MCPPSHRSIIVNIYNDYSSCPTTGSQVSTTKNTLYKALRRGRRSLWCLLLLATPHLLNPCEYLTCPYNRTLHLLTIFKGTSWTKEDHEVLDLTLRYAPDTTPCDLSIICRKPCREVSFVLYNTRDYSNFLVDLSISIRSSSHRPPTAQN